MRLTTAEWQLMKALWKGHPATAREISDRITGETGWAYTTIKTMLSRLAAKGALAEEKRGNVSIYEPLVTPRSARLAALKAVAEEAFDGAFGTLMHFLVEERKLSASERDKLLKVLEKNSGKGDGHGNS